MSDKKFKCDTCQDTGFYGDNYPGKAGNREWQPCDQCPAASSPGAGLPINAPRLVYWGHVEQRLIPKENFCEELCDVVLELHPIGVGAELAALRARLAALTTAPRKPDRSLLERVIDLSTNWDHAKFMEFVGDATAALRAPTERGAEALVFQTIPADRFASDEELDWTCYNCGYRAGLHRAGGDNCPTDDSEGSQQWRETTFIYAIPRPTIQPPKPQA